MRDRAGRRDGRMPFVILNARNAGRESHEPGRHGPGNVAAVVRCVGLRPATEWRHSSHKTNLRAPGGLLKIAREALLVVAPLRHPDLVRVALDCLGYRFHPELRPGG